MGSNLTPRWLNRLERALGWLAVTRIAVLVLTLQAAGFLMVSSDPAWVERLALLPDRVLYAGELWRVLTWLALPISLSPFWVIMVLWFLWFIINSIEDEIGPFQTTLYILVSTLVTVAYALLAGYPITDARQFESALFLAAAALHPEVEILLFFIVPVKLKWLAVVTLVLILRDFAVGSWGDRFYLLSILSSYILFFGPAAWSSARRTLRRKRFQGKFRP